jgi:hypothetical protein
LTPAQQAVVVVVVDQLPRMRAVVAVVPGSA